MSERRLCTSTGLRTCTRTVCRACVCANEYQQVLLIVLVLCIYVDQGRAVVCRPAQLDTRLRTYTPYNDILHMNRMHTTAVFPPSSAATRLTQLPSSSQPCTVSTTVTAFIFPPPTPRERSTSPHHIRGLGFFLKRTLLSFADSSAVMPLGFAAAFAGGTAGLIFAGGIVEGTLIGEERFDSRG
jgi:hypothetical protein